MVEHQTPNLEVSGLFPTCSTVVHLSETHIYFPEYCLKSRKLWLPPDMTEKLLTGC